jgi:2-haloalkanoic acid dehalogenase type II
LTERWATFDCYGTLVDWEGGLRDAYASMWPEADPERLLGHHHAVEPAVQKGTALPYRDVLARCLAAVAAIEGLEVPTGRGDALAASLPSWAPFPEVPESLGELRDAGWRLAILSNTDPDLLAASVEAIGVPIDLTITAAEAGSYKPAPGHWDRFFQRSGADTLSHVHVAASLFHDIEPCARLGVTAVWINRLEESTELPRAAELRDLAELPATLERLSQP